MGGWVVGDWRVDARANEISRGAEKVRLEPKAMQVLCFLAERPGTVVSPEELEAAAWPRMVVTTDAVTGTIIKLADGITEDLTTDLSKLSGLKGRTRQHGAGGAS
jgi:DNA-binding winged helix-turn-helix (wHTH) protein